MAVCTASGKDLNAPMGDVAGTPVPLGSSVLASGTRGCRGSEDGLAGRQVALNHGVEESGPARGEVDNDAREGPGAGPRVAIQSLSEFLRDGQEEKGKGYITMG